MSFPTAPLSSVYFNKCCRIDSMSLQSLYIPLFSSFLCFASMSAIIPTINGQAIDVPLNLAYELFKKVLDIFTPGHAQSISSPLDEKFAILP